MISVWFILFPGAEVLDLAGPWSVLGYANEALGRKAYDLRLASPRAGEQKTRHGLAIAGAEPLEAMLAEGGERLVVIAGGAPSPDLPAPERETARWLQAHAGRFRRIASVCTGAFVLGAAGLLDGRQATTHWLYRDALREAFPRAQVADDDLFLEQDGVWTSAGITAGIDMMLAIVEADWGHEAAIEVAKGLVLFLRRSGRQAQFSHVLQRQAHERSPASSISGLITRHIGEPLPVERLAELAGMSPRNFSRHCVQAFGEPPAALVRRMRLEESRRMLEQTSLPLKVVALQSGLGDPATLWRAFVRHLGVTPDEYRARFR